MPGKRKIFYGWWMVLVCTFLNFILGGAFFYGFTTFFNPIRQTFGWTAAVTSVAFVLQRLESGILGPIAGILVDRIGPRKLMLPGWIIAGLGLLLMSRINSLWEFYGSFLLTAVGASFGSFIVMNTAVANWFSRKRSRALTFLYLGFGASGVLVPLVALSISQFGWRTSLVIIGIGFWAMGIPLSSLMRHKPSQYGYLPDGDDRAEIYASTEIPAHHSPRGITKPDSGSSAMDFTAKAALRTRAFWLLSFAFFFQHIATSAVMVHIVPSLESVNIPTGTAAAVVTGMTLSSLIGRLGFGFLGDFKSKRHLIAIALTLQAIGIFLFSYIERDKTWLIVPFLLLYGPGYGGPTPLRPAIQADYFGISSFGVIMGLMAVISMLGGLTSPVFAGWMFDVTGSYTLAWRLMALVTIPAVPLILLAKPPIVRQEPQP